MGIDDLFGRLAMPLFTVTGTVKKGGAALPGAQIRLKVDWYQIDPPSQEYQTWSGILTTDPNGGYFFQWAAPTNWDSSRQVIFTTFLPSPPTQGYAMQTAGQASGPVGGSFNLVASDCILK